MKNFLVLISIFLMPLALSAQGDVFMEKPVNVQTKVSCEHTNKALNEEILDLQAQLSVVSIELGTCTVVTIPSFGGDKDKGPSYAQSAKVRYQVRSVLGNY